VKRVFDLIVYGATGYTGRLIADESGARKPTSPGLEVKALLFGPKCLKVLRYCCVNGLSQTALGGGPS